MPPSDGFRTDQQVSDTPGVNPELNGAQSFLPRMPEAVRRAAARAEELQSELQMAAGAEVEAAVVGGSPPEGESQPPSDTPLQPSPVAPQPPGGDEQTWQARYRTLQGKFDHEVPQLQMHIRQLENLIATMQAAPRETRQDIIPPASEVEIPEEDYTTYGPDFVESTRRWARAEVQRDLLRQQQQIDELKQYHQQSSGDRLKDRVRAELDRDPELAGRWQQLDTDPGFNAWLNDFDPFSGARRLDMLREAYAGGDAVRTGRFFKAYLHEHTDQMRTPTVQPVQTPVPVTRSPNGYYGNGADQVDLAAYAAPGRASHATPGPGAPSARLWTNRDIQAFYDGRMRGRFKGREAEADRLERDILAAAAEGRISQ